jgi:TIR domain
VGGLAVDRRQVPLWDWPVGPNFVVAISDALERADRVVALLSAAYFDRSRYTTEEWTAAALHVPGRDEGRLVPVRVEDVPVTGMPAVLRPLVFCDFVRKAGPELPDAPRSRILCIGPLPLAGVPR